MCLSKEMFIRSPAYVGAGGKLVFIPANARRAFDAPRDAGLWLAEGGNGVDG